MIKRKRNWNADDWANYYKRKDKEAVPLWAWCITWGFMIVALIADCLK